MSFVFKSFQKITGDQISHITANTPINDITPGSVILNLIEMVSQEIYQNYIQMVNIIQSYNLETTTGEELDNRALEYGLVRESAFAASGYATIGDNSFTKVSTNIFAGTNGAVSGQLTLDIDDSTNFPATGSIIVGRGTNNEETVDYTAIIDNVTYYTLTLDVLTPLTNDHKVGESIILSQGGVRTVSAGTVIYVPSTNISEQINFTLNEDISLSDGEDSISTAFVTCSETGAVGNVPVGAITDFEAAPFPSAIVENPEAFTNGRDEETDDELRDRIRNYIQSIFKGTEIAIKTGISGLTNTEQTKRVVSSSFIESLDFTLPSLVYIDDGTGFEPVFSGKAIEYVTRSAAGTEKILQLDNFPLIKASLITRSEQPFNINSGDRLIIAINDVEEEIIFSSLDFTNEGAATAREISIAINDRMRLVEARTTDGNSKVIIQAVAQSNEKIKVIPPLIGVSANDNLQFEENLERYTLKLYKNDLLLNKDGLTGFVDTPNNSPFVLAHGQTLLLYIDNKTTNLLTITFNAADFVDITQATALEVAAAINSELPGGYATTILDESKVRIYSRWEDTINSYITIDAAGTANPGLGFSAVTSTQGRGQNKDYVLNRYNGQIELTTPLVAQDSIKAGTTYTQAFLECASAEDYNIGAGQNLIYQIDGGPNQTITFAGGTYTAQQVADIINDDSTVNGINAYAVTKGADIYLRIATNTFDDSVGSIEVTGGTAVALDFPVGTLSENQQANLAYAEPENEEDYTLGPDQNLVLLLDQDASDRVFNFVMSLNGTVTNSISDVQFDSTNVRDNYSNDNDFFIDYIIRFTNTTATAALQGYSRIVSAYTGALGRITIAAGEVFPAVPAIGDEFDLIPITAENITNFFNNTSITPFSIYADIRLIKNGIKPQINTQTEGSSGAVQITGGSANSVLIPFTNDGTAVGNFEVDNIEGLYSGVGDMPVATAYYGGMRVVLDNVLNSYTYSFTTDGTGVGTFTLLTARKLNINDGCIIKDDGTHNTYLNGYINDISEDLVAGGSYNFHTNGNANGEFQINANPLGILEVGDLVVINSTMQNAYTNGYIADITYGVPPNTITIYDYDTEEAKDLTSFLIADTAVILYDSYTVEIFDRTTGVAQPLNAGATDFDVANSSVISSIYDKGFIRDITPDAGTGAEPYTITIYDEDTLLVVPTLQIYTLDYGASIKDRNHFHFDDNVIIGVDGYKYYTGLLQEVQWKIDGLESDPVDYPGIKAAGPHIEVAAPTVRPVKLSLDITTQGDITVGSIENNIKTQISTYINNLGVGNNVVLSEIIDVVQDVIGVYDVEIISPSENIVIADNELARIITTDITLA